MNGELDEERSLIRLLFKTDLILSDFYELYAIEDHGSPRKIEKAYTAEVENSDVLLILFHIELRTPVFREYKTARGSGKKVFSYLMKSSGRSDELDQFIQDEIYQYNPGIFTDPHVLCEKIKGDLKRDLIDTYQRDINATIVSGQEEFVRFTASSSHSLYRYFSIDELMRGHNVEALSKLSVNQLIALSSLIAEESGNYRSALYILEFALLKESNNWILHNNRGLILDEMGLSRAALVCYKRAFKLNPQSDTALYNLGNSYYQLGQYVTAIDYYLKSLEFFPDKANALSRISACYLRLEDKKNSLHWSTLAAEARRDEISITNLVGAYSLNGELEKALEVCEEIKARQHLYHSVRAGAFFNCHDFQNTIAEIEIASKAGALDLKIALIKFYSLLELESDSKAFQWFKIVESNFPLDAIDYSNIGYRLIDKYNKVEEAVQLYNKSIWLDPSQMIAWNNLQALYGELGQIENCLEACNKALEIQPFDPKSIRNKILVLVKHDRIISAFTFLVYLISNVIGSEISEEDLNEIISSAIDDAEITDSKAIEELLKILKL